MAVLKAVERHWGASISNHGASLEMIVRITDSKEGGTGARRVGSGVYPAITSRSDDRMESM